MTDEDWKHKIGDVDLRKVDIPAGVEGLRRANQQAQAPQSQAPAKQGMIYVPSLSLHFTDSRILQGTEWQQCKDELKKQGMAMPTPYQFKEFLKYLRDSSEQKDKDLFREIAEAGGSWRSEWLNARFEQKNGLYIISEDALINGQYRTIEQKLEDCLMEDKLPGIDMDEWLNSDASHGLPKPNAKQGSLNYWRPIRGRVAGFDAYSNGTSDGICLYCFRSPGFSNSDLGVFGCA